MLVSFRYVINSSAWALCYLTGCRVDTRDSLAGVAIRHGISKKETRIGICIAEGECGCVLSVTIQYVYVTVNVHIYGHEHIYREIFFFRSAL